MLPFILALLLIDRQLLVWLCPAVHWLGAVLTALFSILPIDQLLLFGFNYKARLICTYMYIIFSSVEIRNASVLGLHKMRDWLSYIYGM